MPGFDNTATAMLCAACMPCVVFLMVATFKAATAAAMPPTIIAAGVLGCEDWIARRIGEVTFLPTLVMMAAATLGESPRKPTIPLAPESTRLRTVRAALPIGVDG